MAIINKDTYLLKHLTATKHRESDEFSSQDRISTELSSHSQVSFDQIQSDNSLEIFRAIPKSKASSKLMQQLISKSLPHDLNQIVTYLIPNISHLMVDTYGNYICQTLFHNCSANHRLILLQALRKDLISIAFHCRGTHSLQILIAMSSLRDEEEIYLYEFRGHILEMSKNINASHVIQRLLVTVNNKYFITREFKGHIEELATDKLGVCVLKKCCNDPQIMSEISGHGLMLMQHPYGNYVVQLVLEI